MTGKKIKATEVSFNSITGLTLRNITFHDFENKIFVVGKERTKRQFRKLENIVIFKDHLDVKTLDDKRYFKESDFSKQRCFPPSVRCLKLDLKVWEEIKDLPKLIDADVETELLKALKNAKEF